MKIAKCLCKTWTPVDVKMKHKITQKCTPSGLDLVTISLVYSSLKYWVQKSNRIYIKNDKAFCHSFVSCREIGLADRWKVTRQNSWKQKIKMVGMSEWMMGMWSRVRAKGRDKKWQVSEQARRMKGVQTNTEKDHRTKWNFPPASVENMSFTGFRPLSFTWWGEKRPQSHQR